MHAHRFLGDLEHADALDVARRAGEVLVDEGPLQSDRLEDLRAAVRLVGGDAHLGHHLVEPLADRLDVALARFLRVQRRHRVVQLRQRLQRQVGMDRLGAVAREQREVVHLARRPRLDDQPGGRAQSLLDQMLVHGRRREQRRYRQQLGGDVAIGQDQDVVALPDRVDRVRRQARQRRLHALRAPRGRIADVQLDRPERAAGEQLDMADLLHVVRGQDRLLRLEPQWRLGHVDAEQVRARADERHQRHHQLLADRVDGRVGDLREQLLEIVVEDLRPVGQHRQRGVVAHRPQRFLAGFGHRRQHQLDVFLRVSERLLAVEQRYLASRRRAPARAFLQGTAGCCAATRDTASAWPACASVRRRRRCGPAPGRPAASCPAAVAICG